MTLPVSSSIYMHIKKWQYSCSRLICPLKINLLASHLIRRQGQKGITLTTHILYDVWCITHNQLTVLQNTKFHSELFLSDQESLILILLTAEGTSYLRISSQNRMMNRNAESWMLSVHCYWKVLYHQSLRQTVHT